MSDIMRWQQETLAYRTVEALKKNSFDAVYFQDSKSAVDYIMGHVNSGMKVGFGGSKTISDMGIQDKVKEKGGIILDHNAGKFSPEESMAIRRQQLTCDLFLTGINAITLDGWLVNVDGTGNRVAAMIFGPKKVIAVAGANKIRKNLDSAMERLEFLACPLNNKRLDRPNPCVTSGTCMDCQGQTRICNVYSILKRKPSRTDFSIVLIGESLGY